MKKPINLSLEELAIEQNLSDRDLKYIELRILGHTVASIASQLGISEPTVYRIGSKPNVKTSMAQIMTVALTSTTVNLGNVMENVVSFWDSALTDPNIPVIVKAGIADSVKDAFFKSGANARETQITEMFLNMNAPKPISNSSFDLAR